MFRNAALTVALLGGCVWCLALVARAEDPQPPAAKAGGAFAPVASVTSLMNGQQEQFDALTTLAADAQAKGRWNKMTIAAELLAEFANINTLHKDKPDYQGWARELRATSLLVAAEAKKKSSADENKIKDLVKKLDATCKACHDVYQ